MNVNVERIREEMARQGKSKSAVCAAIGMTGNGFAKVMNVGTCREETAQKICDYLCIDPAEVFISETMENKIVLSMDEASKILNVSVPTLRNMCRSDFHPPFFMVGNRYKFPSMELREWVARAARCE